MTPGGVLQKSGSVGLAMVIWAACGVLSILGLSNFLFPKIFSFNDGDSFYIPFDILGSLSYAELGTLIPKSGCEYAYFLDGFSALHPFWGPIPAFLYSWITVLLLNPMSYAIGCLSFANYAVVPMITTLELCTSYQSQSILIRITALLCLCKSLALIRIALLRFMITVVNFMIFSFDYCAKLPQRKRVRASSKCYYSS